MRTSDEIILRPVITEKAMYLKEHESRYVFQVLFSASKPSIRKAVEDLFKVQVEDVHTMIQHGRFRRSARGRSRMANWKKAIVTLKEGQKIEMFEAK